MAQAVQASGGHRQKRGFILGSLTFGHGVVGFTLDTSCSASPKAPAMLAEVGDNERALLRTEANSVLQLV